MRPGEGSERGGDDVLVGREQEVSKLLALLSESATHRMARSAVVLGPPGIGKSRLAHEIGKLASERGAAVWLGRGDPDGRPAPFGLIGDLLHRLAEVVPGEPVAARRARLRERVGRHLDADILWETAAVLGEAIGTPFIEEGAADSSPAPGGSVLLADLTLRAWEDLLGAELARGPIVLFVDDAQWADAPSMRLLDASLRNLANQPLFVVAFGEPTLTKAFPGLFTASRTVEIRLEELSHAAARKLIGSITGDRLSAASVEALASRAGGNPFVLEGIARDARQSPSEIGISERSAELPQTVTAMAAAQFKACPPDTRGLLRAASVLGDVVSRADLASLLEGTLDPAAIDRAILDARARDLLALRAGPAVQAELAFRSAVGRQVAYAAFTAEDRARAHLLAGHRLAGGERDPMVSAWHFQQGGAPALAIEPCRLAALRALAANDFETAIARAKQAEACGAEGLTLGEMARILAEAHVWRGETEAGAREGLRAMNLLVPGTVSWFQAAAAYGVCSSRLGNTPALHATARDVEGLIAARPTATVDPALRVAQVTVMSRLAIALVHSGDTAAAEPMLGRMHALRVAGALDPLPFALGYAHRAHAVRAHVRGQFLPAFLAFDAAATSFERAGALRDACVDHANAAFMKTELGQNEDAEKRLSAALTTAMRLGLPTVTANAQLNLSLLMTRRRAGFPATAMGETALALYEKQGSARMIIAALIYLARALLAGGARTTAHQRARRATDFAEDVAPYRAYAYAALSATALALGHVEEAVSAAETAMKAFHEVGAEEGEAFVRLSYIEALDAADRVAEAREALAEADAALASRAVTLADPAHREAFLQNIPEHARIVEMAETMGVGTTARANTELSRD